MLLLLITAAYIWSDLHYQDAKGRLSGKLYKLGIFCSVPFNFKYHYIFLLPFGFIFFKRCSYLLAIKKSQKEAKTIIQKISGLENTVMHGQHQSQESLELELSLVHQWKALFVQMQNIYTQESSQLVSFNAITYLGLVFQSY